MTLETLLTIIIILIIGIILIKAIRWILSICLLLVLLYFVYFTFFTYPGALKFSIFQETLSPASYRIDKSLLTKDETINFDPPLEVGEYIIKNSTCKKYNIVILCETNVEKEDNDDGRED